MRKRRWHSCGWACRRGTRLCLVIASAAVGACELSPVGPLPTTSPDAIDRVRSTDLQPRFPKHAGTVDTASQGASRPAVYPAAIMTAAAVKPQPIRGGGEGYELNFENAPVTTVAKVILGDILRVGYTIDPRVQGTVSLASGRAVPKDDILYVLETALRTCNVVLMRDAGGFRLAPAGEGATPAAFDASGDGPAKPGYGITVMPLQYVSVQSVTRLLDSFAMKAGTIRADAARNLLLIQGSGVERRAAVETVLNFDADWMRGQSVGIYPVRNTTPEPLIAELEKIMDAGDGGLSHNLVKFQPITRLSAILVVTSKPEMLRSAETWIDRLDKSQTASVGVKVYRVRYGEARQLARLLNDIFLGVSSGQGLDSPSNQLAPGSGATALSNVERLTGGSQTPTATSLRQPSAPSAEPNTGPSTPLTSLAAGARQISGAQGTAGSPVLPGVRITPDVTNNALLIYANQDQYRIIERALNQLDRPQLQVAIDLTIAEVSLNNNLNYGVQFFLSSHDIGLRPDSGSAINSAAGPILAQTLPGFNFLVGSQVQPRLIINALHNFTNVKVLSNPSLVVIDNQQATLQVGDQVPITTGTATLLSGNNAVVNTVDYRNTGIILRVVPRINSNGNVLLDIEQEISNVADTSTPGSLTPTLSQRKVKSSISVASGQTVLLAGLIGETQSRTRSGVPVLDQIPGIGEAFTQNNKVVQRTELIIFIRPQIIRDSVDASLVAEELRAKLRSTSTVARSPRSVRE